MIKHPKLTLIGAGPGDPELITLKGIRALATADVVLYDALISNELLKFASANAKKVFVGKRAGDHAYTQQQINDLIVDFAFHYGHVVRLKGGDPFVFGRGYEEIYHAESYNIQTEVIPGISSSIAVPELQKIPLTSRGVSESFWVITATNTKGELSGDIYKAARTDATVIVLMGTRKLAEIVKVYEAAGKRDWPVAVIQNGSLPGQKIAIGIMETILEVVEEKKVGGPAVIIIGEVVAEHPEFHRIREFYDYIHKL
ncbi:MAG TPA: uroporphyrinogen-III C-methyltransferase [Anseongella sp.]|nr:uroporphyrinogen-III C-methyltransferase [Anseongella sp.]